MRDVSHRRSIIAILTVLVFVSGCTQLIDTEEPEPTETEYEIEEIAEGLNSPWGIDFIPETDLILITENPGEIALINESEESITRLDGAPEVDNTGQGGMLDVEVHPDYPENQWIYLTYTESSDEGLATHLGRGQLNIEENSLEDFELLHVAEPFEEGGQHFGSRIVFDDNNYVYFTTGDRGNKDFGSDHVSQDTSNELGATLRLTDEGEIPEDNPFVEEEDIPDSIYTYGHRNVQGMTVHPETGEIWQSEHGEEDGDEINILETGENYGWPITHYGCEYGTDEPVAEDPDENPEVVNPVYYWECNTGGFPPAGMTFYTGDYDQWEGDLFVGNLAGQYLGHFEVDGDKVEEREPVLDDRDWRIRDVEQKNDSLYVLIDDSDVPVVEIRPE